MPQEFYVLKCFSCETFQVHIVKKAKKWECKMCGAKQSLKRNYGKGSSKDCRNQVMKLNELRLSKGSSNQSEAEFFGETWEDGPSEELVKEKAKESKPTVSKWAEYVEENEPESEVDDNHDTFLIKFVDKKKKRVKKIFESCSFKNKKVCREQSEVFSKSHREADESCCKWAQYVEENKPESEVDDNHDNFLMEFADIKKRRVNEIPESCAFKSKKVCSKQNEVFCKNYERADESYYVQSSEEIPAFNQIEQNNHSKDFTPVENNSKPSKYAKYLQDEEDNNDSNHKANKTSNIFESSPTDLDDILNF